MVSFLSALKKQLNEKKANHLYRSRRISESPQQTEMIIDGRKVISFCSNDYLGLANHPLIKEAFIKGIEQYGVGSGAAHLINGHTKAHHVLEETLAEFTGYPRTLLFSTGYMANLGITQALVRRGDSVFEDRLNHASLIDGALLSGARLKRYAHNDADSLTQKLASHKTGKKLVLSDAVFSMDGDIINAQAIVAASKQYDACLMLDDAHGFGALGKKGRGTLEHTETHINDVPIYMATLGKAVGTAGAFIAGSDDLIETLIQQARTYIYTTAQPPAIAVATIESLRLINDEPQHREHLQRNIDYFKRCADESALPLSDSDTAIQPIIIGDAEKTVQLSEALFDKGYLITAIRPPTVPKGTARLRITLSAAHTKTHIDQLIECINNQNNDNSNR